METVAELADGIDASPLAVSLAWVRDRLDVTAAIVGARTADQLEDSLAAEHLTLGNEARRRLDEVSKPRIGYPEFAFAKPRPREGQPA